MSKILREKSLEGKLAWTIEVLFQNYDKLILKQFPQQFYWDLVLKMGAAYFHATFVTSYKYKP